MIAGSPARTVALHRQSLRLPLRHMFLHSISTRSLVLVLLPPNRRTSPIIQCRCLMFTSIPNPIWNTRTITEAPAL
jgi:hypothetical protein